MSGGKHITGILGILAAACLLLSAATATADTKSRIKDLASLEGTTPEPLVGYGLVVGLGGTGDGSGSTITINSIASMLEKMDVTVDPSHLKPKNVAAVWVTARLDPSAPAGSRVDVTVNSLNDAISLAGGQLVMTPLKAADGTLCVLAQGSVSVGGFAVKAGPGNGVRKNHSWVGTVPNGGLVKVPLGGKYIHDGRVAWLLHHSDFATAADVARVINVAYGPGTAQAQGSQRVLVVLPEGFSADPVPFIADMGVLEAQSDAAARVVVNERTGTIIVGKHVKLGEAAVAHGSLKVTINTYYDVSQPSSFARRGRTVVTPEVNTQIEDKNASVLRVPDTNTVGDVVAVLNEIGASPTDIIAILEALKVSGSLQAELILM